MTEEGFVKSICISAKKGVRKYQVESAYMEKNKGILNDAHGDGGFRQVSLLSNVLIEEFANENSIKIDDGIFGENIITEGLNLSDFKKRTEFQIGGCSRILIVQHGKECHDNNCPIGQQTGKCLMPESGTFVKVLSSGELHPGQRISKLRDQVFLIGFITISDKASSGARADRTLETMQNSLLNTEYELIDHAVVPDEPSLIEKKILNMTDFQYIDLVITCGGTGLSIRDITPEVTKSIISREIPGIAEILRAESYKITPYSSLSRGIAGTRKKSIIVNLPGSPKAVKESIPILLPMLDHAIIKVQGDTEECGID